jgi:hypothetical protein
MLYERNKENMKTKIDYAAIREAKQAMIQRFMQAKKQAEQNGQTYLVDFEKKRIPWELFL